MVADGDVDTGESTPRTVPTRFPRTVPPPGAGTFLTSNTTVDVAATMRTEGGPTAGWQNTIRAGGVRNVNQATGGGHHDDHHREIGMGPYRDKDVLLSLQLFAYYCR